MRQSKVLFMLGIVLAFMMFICNAPVWAATSHELGIVQNREDGYSYKIKTGTVGEERMLDVWKIVEYINNGISYDNAIYCIKGGPGFGGTITNPIEHRIYNVNYDLKNVGDIPANYKNILPSDEDITTTLTIDGNEKEITYTNYNAVLWILDNMYLPKDENAAALKENLLKGAFKTQLEDSTLIPPFDLSQVMLTDSDIEFIQQLAIWHFTNSGDNEYDFGTKIVPAIQLYDKSNKHVDLDFNREDDMKQLYVYLIENAMINAHKYGNGDDRHLTSPIEVLNTTLTSEYVNNNILVGPFKIEKKSDLAYTLNAKVLNQDKNEITDYTLYTKSSNGNKVLAEGKTISDLVGQEFYIAVPQGSNTTELSLVVSTDYFESKPNFWTVSGSNEDQPVVMVEKVKQSKEQTVGLNYNFDLALRKFITGVNDTAITSRVPEVKIDNDGKITYTHDKTPVLVENGDIVVYTLRIYNEGKVAGYAQEIKDNIPAGLEFLPDNEINKEYKWKLSVDGRFITTDYLKKDPDGKNLIKEFNPKLNTTLAYKDVKVAFKVTEPNSSKNILINIAEISDDADENGNPITDIDSTPDNGVEGEDDIDKEYVKLKDFDLALRKFITGVNDMAITNRVPEVTVSSSGKIIYKHDKTPVSVHNGDVVIYTIRIYNEGQTAGYANLISDVIPEGTEFIIDNDINVQYRWKLSADEKTITTDYLSYARDEDNILNPASNGKLDYKDVQIALRVTESNNSAKILINTAEIADDADKNGNPVDDIDSIPNNKNEEVKDENHNFKEDDIDKEYLKVEVFDLALRKFITAVNDNEITTRVPEIKINEEGKITYIHPKDPVVVANADFVTYTIRVYNEGSVDGYAKLVYDALPDGLQFVANNEINKQYGWVLSEDGKTITTDYLSRDRAIDNVIKAFDRTTMQTPDYKDLKVVCKVTEPNNSTNILINTAEIADDSDGNGKDVVDIDSTPNNKNEEGKDENHNFKEDDIDKEYLKLQYFDLALRKFITAVNDNEITTRVPEVSINEDGKITYIHPKEPIIVANSNIVTYTIRVYNEGTTAGYAESICDDVPEGLEFIPDNEINKQYGWKLSEDGKSLTTDYLSRDKAIDNILKAFDRATMQTPDYKDVKIAFKVTNAKLPEDKILINTAEIAEDADKNGNSVDDIDSIPNNKNEEGKDENHNFKEDDIDKEYIKVQYFDLALLKWVNKVIYTVDGTTTERETGHTGQENPEPVVKQEVDRKKLDSTIVKFEYTIRITNEGQIAGYAKEISDYIPEGLEFVQSDNPNWTVADGKVTTRQLEGTLLQPGESADVKIILKWINNSENMGVKINVAEISEDYNDYNVPDIDSTPNNKVEGEDDIDEAPVALSIKTGGTIIYFALTGVILAVVIGGVLLIRKYVA